MRSFSRLVTSNRYRVGSGIGDRYFTADVADGVTAAEVTLAGQNHLTATHATHDGQTGFALVRTVHRMTVIVWSQADRNGGGIGGFPNHDVAGSRKADPPAPERRRACRRPPRWE